MTEWLERNGFIKLPTSSLTDDEIQAVKSILGEPLEERAMRLIDADALLRDIEHYHLSDGKFQHWVEIQPTIEPKKGKWIPVTRIYKVTEEQFPKTHIEWVDATEPDEIDGVRCFECGTVYDFIEARNWCSECGADMRGDKHETN